MYPAWMVALTVVAAALVVVAGGAVVVRQRRRATQQAEREEAQRQAWMQWYQRQKAVQNSGATQSTGTTQHIGSVREKTGGATNGHKSKTSATQTAGVSSRQNIRASRAAKTTTIQNVQRTGQETGSVSQPTHGGKLQIGAKSHSKRRRKGRSSHQVMRGTQGGSQQVTPSIYIDMAYEGSLV